MQQDLLTLLKLQQIDRSVMDLERQKAEFPRLIAQLEQEQAEAEQALAEQKEALRQIEKERRRYEIAVDTSKDKVRKYQSQLFEVKTNKQYDALQLEIQHEKEQTTRDEDEILRLMSSIDELTGQIEEQEQRTADRRQRTAAQQNELQSRLQAIDKQLERAQNERERVANMVRPRLLSTYNRIGRRKRGLAVVCVKKGACGGCFKTIPLQKVSEIRKMARLITCESCGRILVWDNRG